MIIKLEKKQSNKKSDKEFFSPKIKRNTMNELNFVFAKKKGKNKKKKNLRSTLCVKEIKFSNSFKKKIKKKGVEVSIIMDILLKK
jgi:hypothetical protein